MLNEFGKIAAAEIVFYTPILFISFFVVLRYGFSRREGWISLHIFSTVRILAAVLSIVSQSQSNPSSGILTAVGILQALGLSPLLLATLGFITNIADYGLPDLARLGIPRVTRIVLVVGVVLAIVGGTKRSPSNTPSDQSLGHTLSRVGSILFVAGYVILFCIHILLWGAKKSIPINHRKLLASISFSFPFLGVRVLYSVLGAFVRSPSKWSPLTGDWQIYLVMGLIMEYVVVSSYVITGTIYSLHKGTPTYAKPEEGRYELGNKSLPC